MSQTERLIGKKSTTSLCLRFNYFVFVNIQSSQAKIKLSTFEAYMKKVNLVRKSKKHTLKVLMELNDTYRSENLLTISKFNKLPIKTYDDKILCISLKAIDKEYPDDIERFGPARIKNEILYQERKFELLQIVTKFAFVRNLMC